MHLIQALQLGRHVRGALGDIVVGEAQEEPTAVNQVVLAVQVTLERALAGVGGRTVDLDVQVPLGPGEVDVRGVPAVSPDGDLARRLGPTERADDLEEQGLGVAHGRWCRAPALEDAPEHGRPRSSPTRQSERLIEQLCEADQSPA